MVHIPGHRFRQLSCSKIVPESFSAPGCRAKKSKMDPPRTLYDFYRENWVAFGEILTDMEQVGDSSRGRLMMMHLRIKAEVAFP